MADQATFNLLFELAQGLQGPPEPKCIDRSGLACTRVLVKKVSNNVVMIHLGSLFLPGCVQQRRCGGGGSGDDSGG